tara:strand:- start:129 stop:611 length:483 start_codon:yes stop_codon:yes gene_type:complete
MKKLILLSAFLIFACSSDDSNNDNNSNDKIIGTWELEEYNQTIFEANTRSSYRCLELGSNDYVFRSDGTATAYFILCIPYLSAENPTVNIDLEEIEDNDIGQAETLFQWENRDGTYYIRQVFDNGTLSPEGVLPFIFFDSDTRFRSPESEDMGELIYKKL